MRLKSMSAMALLALLLLGPQGLEEDIWERINEYRAKHARAKLAWSDAVAQEARRHCQDIISGRVPMGHEGFDGRIQRLSVKLAVRGAAENVGSTQGLSNVAATMVDMWVGSPGHRKNIEGAYFLTGIGVARGRGGTYCATQIFLNVVTDPRQR